MSQHDSQPPYGDSGGPVTPPQQPPSWGHPGGHQHPDHSWAPARDAAGWNASPTQPWTPQGPVGNPPAWQQAAPQQATSQPWSMPAPGAAPAAYAPPPAGFSPTGAAPAGFVPGYGQPQQGPYVPGFTPGFVPGLVPGFVPGLASGYAAPQQAARPGVMQLRPQTLGDILDVAFKVIRGNPGGSLGTALLGGLLSAVLGSVFIVLGVQNEGGGHDPSGASVALMLAGSVLAGLMFVAPAAALVHVFGQAVLGRRASAGASLRVGLRKVLPLLGLGLLTVGTAVLAVALLLVLIFAIGGDHTPGALVALVVIAAGLAGLYLSIRLCFSAQALVLEDAGPVTAIKRSWALTRRRFWRTLGILMLAQIVLSIVSYIVQMVLSLLVILGLGLAIAGSDDGSGASGLGAMAGVSVVGMVLGLLMTALTYPFLTNVMGALYVDARIRDEGLAAQLMQLPMQQTPGVTLTKGDLAFPRPLTGGPGTAQGR